MLIASSWPGARISDTSPGAVRVEPLSSSPGSASAMGMASFTPDGKLMRKRLQSTSSVLETVSPTVKRVVEVKKLDLYLYSQLPYNWRL